MVRKQLYILIFVSFTLLSCGEMLLGPNPKNTPEDNFKVLWNDFDKRYSYFNYKKINWDSLYSVYRPKVNSNTSGEQLFNIFSELLSHLKDGHVNLYTPYGNYAYTEWYDKYPVNFIGLNKIDSIYLTNFNTNGVVSSGYIQDSIGYIYIYSFGSNENKYYKIDEIIEDFDSCKGIIIDVRNNGGGSDTNGSLIASRFYDKKRLFRYYKYRNGIKHSDFTDYIPTYIEPEGEIRYTKPVVLLTNRGCFSSTEAFIQAMDVLPHVTVVGDTSGGGTGNPVSRELPNGWKYRLSGWIQYTVEKKVIENIGLAPDIFVTISDEDMEIGKDTILETAIQMLK